MKKVYVMLFSFLACILLYMIEQLLAVEYITKTFAKILLFTLIPYVYMKHVKKTTIKDNLNLSNLKLPDLKLGLILGLSSFAILIIAYIILKSYIDFDLIENELIFKSKITPSNFLLIGFYITFINSFLEEFFFRGFIFINLYDIGSTKLAYIYSSLLFALYHIGIFKNWFNPYLIALALFGLIAVGFIFDWVDTKSNNFINSWIIHILADSAIILIGLIMFGMI